MPESAHDFFKRFLTFSIGPGISALIGFVSVPITTWLVAPEDFGKTSMFAVFLTMSNLILFLDLDQAFVREFHTSGDKRKILFNTVSPPLAFSILFSGAILLLHRYVSEALYGSENLTAALATALPIPFLVIERFNLLIVRMEEKGKIYSAMQILRGIVNLVLLISIVYFHRSYLGVISARAIAICVFSSASFLFVNGYWSTGNFYDGVLLKKLLRYGLPLVPAALLGWVLNAMDKVALRIWADFGEVGLYAAGFKAVAALLLFQAAFTTFWTPTAYRWFETGESLRKFEKVSFTLSFFLCFLGGAIILARHLIILILAPVYSSAATVVPFLIFFPVLYTLSETTQLGINFTRRTELAIWVSAVAAGSNLLGNWLLVPRFGALGASIATAISYMVFFWMRTIISRTVWEKFSIKPHILNLSILTVMSLFAVMQDLGRIPIPLAWIGLISCIAALCILNLGHILYAKRTLFPPRP